MPYGVHHIDVNFDVDEPSLSPRQRELLSFPATWHTQSTDKLSPWTMAEWRINRYPPPAQL